ncbi:MAG: hypothetical protein A49_16040 [Methyloceanibacter sp.]|nr:MAG: hypothetical protein A49_16040 [Methyloceanibacter sp.]
MAVMVSSQTEERAKSILCALRFSEGLRCSKALQIHAKTHAKNNVRIVDKDNKFPHYTEDTMTLQ